MNKFLHPLGRAAAYVCAVWVLADGLFLVASFLGWSRGLLCMGDLFSMDPHGWPIRGLLLVFAVPGIVLPLLFFLQPLAETRGEGQIRLDNQKGEVRISTRTISDYLQKKSAGLEGVDSVRIRVRADEAGKVSLNVDASVYAEEPLPAVTRRIQDHIEKELKGTIGVSSVEGVHIRFKRIGDFTTAALPAPSVPKHEDPSRGGENPPTRND